MLEYVNIDQKLHLLCQILAMVTANFLPEKEDYSHTNLVFDPIAGRISSRWMENPQGKIFLAIDIHNSRFQWINDSLKVTGEIMIKGKTLAELETEIASALISVGFESTKLSEPLKYEMEAYLFKNDPFDTLQKEPIKTWTIFRSLANQACKDFLFHINSEAEVRIWPHHFDTGIYKEIGGKVGVGFGLAAKDSMVNSPYFYLSGYGLDREIVLKNQPELMYGGWETEDWKGAVLPLNQLEQIENHKKRFNGQK